jgi:hypothetical protein
VSAYAAGSKVGGPALGAVFAGIAAAGVAAHIAKLLATNPSSSGGSNVSAAGGGGAEATAAATQQPAQAPQTMFLTVQGRFFDRETVRGLAAEMIKFQNDGGKVVLQ